MPNPQLPEELLDHIVDLLRDTKDALRNCCLASKSWVPRSRKLLFVQVAFFTQGSLESWKETFPDPSKSPAHFTNTLFIDYLKVTVADPGAGGWIRGFSHVVHLALMAISNERTSTSRQSLSSYSTDPH